MSRPLIDETDNVYGRLRVLERTEKPEGYKYGGAYWLCLCDPKLGGCGTKGVVCGRSLRGGNARSCECYLRDSTRRRMPAARLPRSYATMRAVLRMYKYRAAKHNIPWEIDEFQFIHLTQERCFYCGDPPSNHCIKSRPVRNGSYIYQGLDRVDNDQGYTLDNVVPCCWKCNKMKKNMEVGEWLDHIEKILRRHRL